MVNTLIFGGVSSRDYFAVVDASDAFVGAERDVTTLSVPGRNGDLVFDNGRYKNVEVTYTLYFRNSRQLADYRNAILSKTGYQRLEDSHLPYEFRMARISDKIDAAALGYRGRSGELKITFDCKPQRFLTSGESPIQLPKGETTLYNPTGMVALPLIYCSGLTRFSIGDMSITYNFNQPAYIDSDSKHVYYEGESRVNRYFPTPPGFPTLSAGKTVINATVVAGTAEIYPRWWML